jgi:hypothetical protein
MLAMQFSSIADRVCIPIIIPWVNPCQIPAKTPWVVSPKPCENATGGLKISAKVQYDGCRGVSLNKLKQMTTTISSATTASEAKRNIAIAKSVYQTDHQVKLLNLHADAESLLQQLQAIKQQRDLSIDD